MITEITYEQFMEHVYTEDVKDKSLVGRYVKALCDYPNAGKVKKNEYGLIIKELPESVYADFPSQKNYCCTKGLFGKNYELMPEGFKPPTDKELLLEEAKKRFPIGCRYKNTIGTEFTLELDSTTYYFTGNMIYAHSGGGCLYDDGKWAEIISEETPKFEVSRWYKINNCWYARFKTIHNSGNLWLFSEAISKSGYYSKESSNLLMADIPRLNPILLTDLTEIQTYLPDGHPDKIKVDVIPEYVECIEDDEFVGVWDHTKGKIYKVEDNRILTNTSKAGIYIYSILGVKCFKPSTKEAYEKQNNKQSTVMEVGKWYRLPKCSNYIVKYSHPGQCSEYIANNKYNRIGGGCNTNDAILVDVSEIQQYLPDGHVDKITKQSVHKFKIGDIVKVLKESTYFVNEYPTNIPSNLIIHGSCAHGSNPKAKIVNIYDKYYIVNFTDSNGKKTQLGYLEDNLVLVNPIPTMKKTGKEGKWFNHKSHGDIRYEEKIDEVLVKCYSPVHGNVIVTESSLIDDSSTPEPVVEKFTVEVKTYNFPTPSYSSPSEDDELILKPFTKVKEKPKTRRYNFLVFD